MSHYEASDDESVLEFEKLENQLQTKKQDVRPLNSEPDIQQQINQVDPSLQQITAKPKKQKGRRKKKTKQDIAQDIAVATLAQDKAKPPAKKSGCLGIFCCGYCCSKGAGADDKGKEADLSRIPEKMKIVKKQKDNTALPQDLSIELEEDEQ